MPTAPITLIKGDKISSVESEYGDALPENMYAVIKEVLGTAGYLKCAPGLTSFATGKGIDRGACYNERFSLHFRISGNRLIAVSTLGGVTDLGVVPGTSQATIKDLYSFNTQGIIADGKFFLYSPGGGLNEVIDADLGSPIDGVWVDGYYFMTDGEYIFHTDIDDETSIDPLKFATAEFMPDPSNGVAKTQDNKVMVFGRYTIEYFMNAATANFAFSRIATRGQKIGIVATHAKCEGSDAFYITGSRKNESLGIHAITVGSAVKVSTREIDKILEKYTEPELVDMRMEYRSSKNVQLILIHLPEETLCFNETVARALGLNYAWSILRTDITGTQIYRAINGIFDARNAKWIYGDKRDETIGYLDDTVFTQYDEAQEWLLYSPFINLESFSIDEIKIKTVPGHTTFNDAKVAISLTRNGVTYGTEAWLSYGDPAAYTTEFIARRLGYVPSWVGFKFRGATKSRITFSLFELTYE